MSTPAETPVRLPPSLWLAALFPSILVAGFELSRELGGPSAPVPAGDLILLWLFTTVPLATLVFGLRTYAGQHRGGDVPPEVQAALEAVSRAEILAARSAEAQARIEGLLRERAAGAPSAAPPADMVPRSVARRTALLAAGLAILFVGGAVGLAGVFTGPAGAPRTGHIHPAFAVFAAGAQVNYSAPFFDLSNQRILRAHLHVADGYPGIMHIEGKPGLTLAEFFRDALAANLTETTLELDGPVHGNQKFVENGTHRVRLFVAPGGGPDFVEVKPVASYVPRDHDRILVSFGDERGADLAAQEATVPTRFPP